MNTQRKRKEGGERESKRQEIQVTARQIDR